MSSTGQRPSELLRGMMLGARNPLTGEVTEVLTDGLMPKRLGLKIGDAVTVIIKSTEVMVAK